ncbi:ABC transporter ATP-binding protein [Candidatus Roizmanbacteria bacterium]|nr:ABC transporter ATP-binding protein [Candidatus Roizmanbacteria bacterium]
MQEPKNKNNAQLLNLGKPYIGFIALVLVLSLFTNGLNLVIPIVMASALDTFRHPEFTIFYFLIILSCISFGIFALSSFQTILQTYLSERIARDMRSQLITKISEQQFSFITKITPEKLLTNLTGDIDNIKLVIAQGIVQIFSSVVIIFGASILLLSINWKLALIVLMIIPLIVVLFFTIFSRIRKYFVQAQSIIDKLNKTINESIVASALIRIVNSQQVEFEKFSKVSGEAKHVGTSIVNLFSSMIPLIGIIANVSIVIVLFVGGKSIVAGTFTLGGFTAFMSYISMLIFPIIVIGFISNALARAAVSYTRISEVLYAPAPKERGTVSKEITGDIRFKNVVLEFNRREILRNISFHIKAKSRTAILGPTAAGKTQLFYLLAGLLEQTSGEIEIDGIPLQDYSHTCLSDQIGLVFQDSSLFNTSVKENINFKNSENEKYLEKAIQTAEIDEFIHTLPQGIHTKVAERGTTLSGGQKQRITLARALVINPKILLLDDFTARVDKDTEKRIFANLKQNYSDITQILITQQISSVEDFDEIILIMEGEILAKGTHEELLRTSVEYEQIYNSQMSVS